MIMWEVLCLRTSSMDPLQSIIAYKASCAGRMQNGCMLGNCTVVFEPLYCRKRGAVLLVQRRAIGFCIEARLRCDAIDAGIY